MTSEILQKDMGSNIKIYEADKLGEGSYGCVYRCSDENGKEYAVKCIPMKNDGIPNVMELMIMESIHHPNLNTAVHTYADKDKIYIFQKLAKSDLCKYTRTPLSPNVQKNNVNPELLRYWSYSLIQAVACLHQQNIIHGDIKSNNVFLFDKGNIKLGDFSLAIQVPSKTPSLSKNHKTNTKDTDPIQTYYSADNAVPSVETLYYHRVCTYSHRPPECWFKKGWSFPLDIWALGCTLFEIAYGQLLFPCQGKIQDKKSKNVVYKKAVNCMLEWIYKGPQPEAPPKWVKPYRTHLNVNHRKPILPPQFHLPQYVEFNRLLFKMLRADPIKRPTIRDILKDPYFDGLHSLPYKIQSVPSKSMQRKESRRIERYLEQFNIKDKIKSTTIQLYEKCYDCKDLNEKYKVISCLWIAHKLMRIPTPKHITTSVDIQCILESEKIISHHLNFRFHI